MAKDQDSRHRLCISVSDALAKRVVQPHEFSATGFERAESMATETRYSNNT